MNNIYDTDMSFIKRNESCLYYTLLFGKENMNSNESTHILNPTLGYILLTERFNVLEKV